MTAEDVFGMEAKGLAMAFALRPAQADRVARGLSSGRARAEDTARRLHALGITMMTTADAAYPARLLSTAEHPPAALYCRGDTHILYRPLVALANSNGASPDQIALAGEAVRVALLHGFVPVTGHNRAEYQGAALIACRSGAPVCYVLDRGILTVAAVHHGAGLFPSARIWQKPQDARHDLVLSSFAPRMPAAPGSNRRRDEIIVHTADAVVATHVRPGGTMQSLIARAASAGTPVAWLGPAPLPCALREVPSIKDFGSPASDGFGAWLTDARSASETGPTDI
jgi:DNA processing protein